MVRLVLHSLPRRRSNVAGVGMCHDCASVEDQYNEIGRIHGFAGLRRPLWPPSWPLWRLEPQLWVMAKGDVA